MKIQILTAILFLSLALHLNSQEIKAMSYNIKYDNTNDTVNNWHKRKKEMTQLLLHYAPDVIGMQEVLHRQLTYFDSTLHDYDYIGVGRDDGKEKGEFSPIFYNSEKYTIFESNTFWLSETPNDISVGWDAAMERICTYGLFESKVSKQQFWVFNTHFDHIGVIAREKSAQLILEKIQSINVDDLPVVLMGDFNLTPEKQPIQLINKHLKDGLERKDVKFSGPSGTYNGFNISAPIVNRIDYIFTKDFDVNQYKHLDDKLRSGKHISDHLPVFLQLEF